MQIQKKNAAEFEKKDEATPSEKKLAAEFGITVEELRYQRQNYDDTAKQEMEHRQMPPDPKIGENEEMFVTGAGIMGGGRERDGQLTETIQAMEYAGPEAVSRERIEEERRALEKMKSQHVQRQHHHEQHHDDYQVIEGGRESIVEDNYVQISPYTSSSEQDNNNKGRDYEPQPPNLPAMAEGMRMLNQSKPSPRDQHNMKERGEGASLPSHFNDGSYDPPNRSPHSSRRPPSPPPHRDTHPPPPADPVPPPPTDPHHQFTIGSMVCLDVQKGEPLYGVLQWVGTVPDFNGTIAGVELVSDYEKCAYSFNTINRSDH